MCYTHSLIDYLYRSEWFEVMVYVRQFETMVYVMSLQLVLLVHNIVIV